jgi:methionyl-tRNA synthetase
MNSKRRVIVTSALPYANNRPHVGHVAGAYLPADIYVRYLRLTGAEVDFVSGSDDYGVAIMLTAKKEGKTPAEVAKYYNAEQKKSFDALNINFDIYSATSQNPHHTETSQDFFKKIFDRGFFEKRANKQFFDPNSQTFLPDRFVKGTCGFCSALDQNGDQCENCGNVLDIESLKNPISVLSGETATVADTVEWLLDLSRFKDVVSSWLDKAKIREGTRKFVTGLIDSGLVKRSMTRDISWGIPVPLEDPDAKGKVLYVWFDAPIGYISNSIELAVRRGQNAEAGRDLWKSKDVERYHFIGEDNSIFHCVIWIAMLSATDQYQLPDGVIVNNFLNIQFSGQEEQKMSKSRGTAVFIEDYLESGGEPDALRYYLTAVAPEKARTAYKPDDLDQKRNSELADILGNLVNRIVSFTKKHIPDNYPQISALTTTDKDFQDEMSNTLKQVSDLLEDFQFKAALEQAMNLARFANGYVDRSAPWKMIKQDRVSAETSLALSLQAIKVLSVVLEPFIPATARKIRTILGFEDIRWDQALEMPSSSHKLGEPVILFPKG